MYEIKIKEELDNLMQIREHHSDMIDEIIKSYKNNNIDMNEVIRSIEEVCNLPNYHTVTERILEILMSKEYNDLD